MIAILKNYLSLIKFSHTIFALPFCFIGFSLAIKTNTVSFNWGKFILVVLCMLFARSAAMAFNRYIDRHFDKKNPRTAIREIPSNIISPNAALFLVITCCLFFIFCCYLINTLCFYLSPIALIIILGYSFTKRFTSLCHLILGLGLALAPIGGYIALTEKFDSLPLLFSFLVFLWTSGFDIIYALQDDEFDKTENLKSIPVFLGRKKALRLSEFFHLLTAMCAITAYFLGNFGWLYIMGASSFIGLLFYQHTIVKTNDLSKVNLAFATVNGFASITYCLFVCSDIFL